jgi:hypothetical protein
MTTGATTSDIHLLEHYGTGATRTLCGVEVPKLFGSTRGNLRWAHVGHETCQDCQKAHQSRIGQLAGSPLPPTQKARPLGRIVRRPA